MPTYDYECKECGKIFEVIHSISAPAKRSLKTDCAQCHNKAPVRRLMGTGGAVIFKGSGFYQTDYRSDSYKKAAKADTETTTKAGDDKSKGEKSAGAESKPKSEPAASPTSSPAKPDKTGGGEKAA